MLNRKGMEIAINSVVAIILGIIMLAGGLALFFKLYNDANNQQELVQKELERRMMEQANSGVQVFVYPDSPFVDRDTTVTFGVGINNILDVQQSFIIDIDKSRAGLLEVASTSNTVLIDSKQRKVQIYLVTIPKNVAKGAYPIVVKVYTDPSKTPDTLYGDPRIVTMNVK